jgi:hypothetical protein
MAQGKAGPLIRFAGMRRSAASSLVTDPFVQRLDQAAKPGTTGRQFLSNLSPIHADWHHSSRTIGFFLFHWECILRFKSTHADAELGGIAPFTLTDFQGFNVPYDAQETIATDDIGSVENFSQDVERWHNNAHMLIGMALGENLMDPRTNIFYADFWRLHYFINDQFLDALAKYKPTGSAPAVAKQIESTSESPYV